MLGICAENFREKHRKKYNLNLNHRTFKPIIIQTMYKSRDPLIKNPCHRKSYKGTDSTDDQQSLQKGLNKRCQRINKTKYKTQMCKNFSEMGYCPYREKCQFAHGQSEICTVEPPSKRYYRTRKCHSFWNLGLCNYGSRCQFSHYELPEQTVNYLEICKHTFTNQDAKQSRLLKILRCEN